LEALRTPDSPSEELTHGAIAEKLSSKELDPDAVAEATKMSQVYVAVAAFENTVRDLISSRLLEEKGANWWDACVSSDIKKRAEQKIADEERIRWHGSRGLSPIYFTELKDLSAIIQQNWQSFENILPEVDWVRHVLRTIERSRNVIMHSGQLSLDDIERIGVTIRDWIRQVGT